jgi:hypothetical protein
VADRWAVYVEGLEGLGDIKNLSSKSKLNIVRAVNATTARFRKKGADLILGDVNLPSNYLNPAAKRLYVAEKATKNNPQSIIRARGRATSLARFITSRQADGVGVTVKVNQDSGSKELKRAFLVKLPAGRGPVDTQFNLGLAIRLRKGQRIRNKKHLVQLDQGLYLLYGPSVDQLFLNATGGRAGEGVATEMTPDMLDFLQREYLRLMEL